MKGLKRGIKLVLGVSFAGLGMMSAAIAADMYASNPWTGFYAGILGGVNALNPHPRASNFVQPKDTSFLVGGLLGYNYQIDHWVLGVEGHIAYTNPDKTRPCAGANWRCNAGADWIGSIRARAGFAANDQVLIFATGGLALLGYEGYTFYTPTSKKYKDSKTFTGWTVGGGFNYRVTDNILVGVEALYARYGRKSMQYDDPYPVKPATFSAFATITYKF
ncbi:outer membrane protein [Thermopetrobacter sp. TC1]|uniref:outer membrane protein n=1 Tax=Thermopetrobacter sp. TC1 TaxID=1495045 RepID=UPI00068B9E93|nr:outer membrane protein [Thermopetrobacter sp. TC1]